tara:strand:+ start:42 stop:722 length:681 start_codon:yes stop_codon:yes gene_type:complete
MPNFNKSKGFQLRSGNKAKAPFKMMGSSPAKQGFMDTLNAFKPESKTKDILKPKEIKTIDTTEAQANTNKPGSKNYTGTDKNTDKSHLSTKTTDKKGEVKTKAFKNDASEPSKPKPELSAEEKAAKKEKFAQGMRDMGEIIESIGDPNASMSKIHQARADRKVAKADKITARKDQDIQNEKDIANTKRTNQLTAQATANLEAEASKLPDTEVKKGGGIVTTGLTEE